MTEPSNVFVVCLGIGTVFLGLICIVLLCKIMSALANLSGNESNKNIPVSQAAPSTPQPIENRQEIIAAISAAVAEELGTDISAIRILSFRKI